MCVRWLLFRPCRRAAMITQSSTGIDVTASIYSQATGPGTVTRGPVGCVVCAPRSRSQPPTVRLRHWLQRAAVGFQCARKRLLGERGGATRWPYIPTRTSWHVPWQAPLSGPGATRPPYACVSTLCLPSRSCACILFGLGTGPRQRTTIRCK